MRLGFSWSTISPSSAAGFVHLSPEIHGGVRAVSRNFPLPMHRWPGRGYIQRATPVLRHSSFLPGWNVALQRVSTRSSRLSRGAGGRAVIPIVMARSADPFGFGVQSLLGGQRCYSAASAF